MKKIIPSVIFIALISFFAGCTFSSSPSLDARKTVFTYKPLLIHNKPTNDWEIRIKEYKNNQFNREVFRYKTKDLSEKKYFNACQNQKISIYKKPNDNYEVITTLAGDEIPEEDCRSYVYFDNKVLKYSVRVVLFYEEIKGNAKPFVPHIRHSTNENK